MKGRITDSELLKGYFIPDMVNEKCDEAFDLIREDAASRTVRTRHSIKKHTIVISVSAAAAILVSLPAAAYFARSGFNFVSHEIYTKNPMEKNDLTPYAQELGAVNTQTHADITIQSIYCDGESLALSFALTPKSADFDKCTSITADIYLKRDGELIESEYEAYNGSSGIVSFNKADDGVFYGVLNMSDVKIEKETQLDIKLAAMKGINGKHMIYHPDNENTPYESGTYIPEETGIFEDVFEFSEVIAPDTSNNKLYEVNETQGNVTLSSVFVTPFKTEIDIEGLGEKQSIRVKDQNGDTIEFINWNGKCILASPYKTSKELIIETFRLNVDDFPTEYSFTVPIEKGFTNKWNVEYDNSNIVYDPPYEVIESFHAEKAEKEHTALQRAVETADKTPTGTPVEFKDYITDPDDIHKEPMFVNMSVNITGSRVEDISDYDIDEDKLNWFNEGNETGAAPGMLLVDYELTNESDESGRNCFCGLQTYSKDLSFNCNEPDYISYKDNGGKDSYMYDFKPHETKKITLGYMIPENIADDGFYAFVHKEQSAYDLTAGNIENGKIQVIELK